MPETLDAADLLARYDAQLRAWMPDRLPPGATVERDGPVLRQSGVDAGGFVTYVSVADLPSDDLDALIARQRDHFVALGRAVEWKLHGHDQPGDLPQRLIAAGFEPEDQETIVVGRAAPLASSTPSLPSGVRLREALARPDLDRIAAMESRVWSTDRSHLAVALERELAADPDGTTVVLVETVDGLVVSAGWVRYVRGTDFATLWGGSTLPEYRGQGIYKALVRYRAQLAVDRGYTLLQVDASDDSRPILERHGFIPLTTTTPYVHPAP